MNFQQGQQYNTPMYQNPYQSRMNQYNSNGITWVQGIEGAKAFQLMPNSNIMLMDSENDGIFYIKISDNVGMCTLRTFKYEEITNVPKNSESMIDTSQFITRDELDDILSKRLGGKNNGKSTVQSTESKPTISK